MASIVRLPFTIAFAIVRTAYAIAATLLPFLPQLSSSTSGAIQGPSTPASTSARSFAASLERYRPPQTDGDGGGDEQQQHDDDSPPFFPGAYKQLVATVKRDLRFAVVYLHSPEHDETDDFCRNVLLSTELTSFLRRENVLLWGASVQDAEGYEVSSTLHTTSYPFIAVLGVISTSGVAQVAVLERLDGGIRSAQQLVAEVQKTLDKHRTYADTVRAERQERDVARQIRQQQDQAYEESLRRDRERQRAQEEASAQRRREEEQAQAKLARREQLIKNRKARRQQLREAFENEQQHGQNAELATLQFVMPNGTRQRHKFPLDASVAVLYDFVDSHDPFDMDQLPADQVDDDMVAAWEQDPYDFLLAGMYPRVEYTDRQLSLRDAGLKSGVSLIVERQ
ncbi:UBX domain-containing protein 10 [Sorochytrium milnesiophthora]